MKISISAIISAACLFLSLNAYAAAPVQPIQKAMLEGDYLAVLSRCDRLIARSDSKSGLDSIYYYRGVSKLKLGQYSSARRDLGHLIDTYPKSRFIVDAYIGIGDSYFASGDYKTALINYKKAITGFPDTELGAVIYYKLAGAASASKRDSEYELYTSILKERYPSSLETFLINEGPSLARRAVPRKRYSIQVGSFTRRKNARRLAGALKGYDLNTYISHSLKKGRTFYRVRVGDYSSRSEAYTVKERLEDLGYPTQFIAE